MEATSFARKELYDLVWSEPMTTLAKKHNLTYYEFRSVCIKNEIPIPPPGHRTSVKYKKNVLAPPLKPIPNEQKITLQPSKLPALIDQNLFPAIRVPDRLTNPDKLITEAKNIMEDQIRKYPHDAWANSSWKGLDISITKENAPRALRIMDTIIKNLRLRGHEVSVADKTYTTITGEKIQINLKELSKRVVVQDGKYPSTELHPTGILYFKMGGFYPKEWRDAKQPLEDQIPAIISRLEQEAVHLKERHYHYRQIREKQEEKNRLLQEAEQKKEKERERFKALLQQSTHWHKSNILRDYLNAMEQKALSTNTVSEKFTTWLTWARQKTDLYASHALVPNEENDF